jgi:hypothetical protein
MNKRLKELAEQAGLDAKEIREDGSLTLYAFENFDLERFAELVRQDEREACAVLCEKMSQSTWTFCNFAEAIRARSEK